MSEIYSSNPHLLVNQTYVPTAIEWQYVNNPGLMLGPWMVGALLDFMFAGILLQQFYFYRMNFKSDALHVKVIVWATMLLATMKTIQAFLIVWSKIIVAYGDWRTAASWPWQEWTEPILGASLGAVAQIYFSIRCYRLSGRKTWLLLGLFFFLFISWGCSFGVGLQIGLKNPYIHGRIPYAVVPMLVSTVLVDSVITLVTLFYLIRPRKGFNPKTDNILARLVIITFEAALPPALSAICDMITSVTQTGNIHATFNMLTPRLYAYSLFFTLNDRTVTRELALGGSDHVSIQPNGSHDDDTRQAHVVVGGRTRSWFPQSKPKSHVRTETETITVHHEEQRSSARITNTLTLSPHIGGAQEVGKIRDDEASSISSTWATADAKAHEMGSMAYPGSKDNLPREESNG